jgi:phage/plasmid-like protein (TIGR03299 family)
VSQETLKWLNTRTLIGYTDQRGTAWHYRRSEQGEEPNHYAGAVPVEDVRRRLFDWEVLVGDVCSRATILGPDGVEAVEIVDPTRKTMMRPPRTFGLEDGGQVLGVFKAGYEPHGYAKWLLDTVTQILDDDLNIGSAGLLRNGAQAWVAVEIPESIETPEGVVFRPHLLATTSFDGSMATSWRRAVTNVVCDNTMAAALRESAATFKVRHSKNSGMKLLEARDALDLVHTIREDFAAEVAELTATRVSDADWHRFLTSLAPTTADDGEALVGRKLTTAIRKRDELSQLWSNDVRVAPWKNTAWGVVQAVNTHAHHLQGIRGAERAERNMARTIEGDFDRLDVATLQRLDKILV